MSETLDGTALLYWVALYFRDHRWHAATVITDGRNNPHSPECVTRLVSTWHGHPSRLALCGPYYDMDSANRMERRLSDDALFFRGMAKSAAIL
jgi:hypothetical protein